jgi:hypothetical protein
VPAGNRVAANPNRKASALAWVRWCIIPWAGGTWSHPVSPQIRTFVPTIRRRARRRLRRGVGSPGSSRKSEFQADAAEPPVAGIIGLSHFSRPPDVSDASNCAGRCSGQGRRRTGPARPGWHPCRRRRARPAR